MIDEDDYELAMVGGVGTAQALMEYATPAGRPRKRPPRLKRPIGFLANIDDLQPADE